MFRRNDDRVASRCDWRRLWLPLGLLAASIATATAAEPYDLGRYQVVGRDAASVKQTGPTQPKFEEAMGDKELCLPSVSEVLISARVEEPPPFMPAALPATRTEHLSVGLMAGQRGSNWQQLAARGRYDGTEGRIRLEREKRDGFRSEVDDRYGAIEAGLTMAEQGSYRVEVGGGQIEDEYAQRGTRRNPTPRAGIDDTTRRLAVVGESTLADGGFFTGRGHLESRTRETSNPLARFSEKATLNDTGIDLAYRREAGRDRRWRGLLTLRRADLEFGAGRGVDLTHSAIGGEYEFDHRGKARTTIGARIENAMDRSHLSPHLRFAVQPSDPWQLELRYAERLGNDDLAAIFLPRRYVSPASMRASLQRRLAAAARYRASEQLRLGAEVFGETVADEVEHRDEFDAGRGMLTSVIGLVDARRRGVKLSGDWQFEPRFTLAAALTLQNPEQRDAGRKLSYEAKRALEVSLGYDRGPLAVTLARRQAADRVAIVGGREVSVGDYSRADLEMAYRFNRRIRGLIKVKDLYDEGDSLRYDVPEEGRVTMAGLEADF